MDKHEIIQEFLDEMDTWAEVVGDEQIPSREMVFSDSAAAALAGNATPDEAMITILRKVFEEQGGYQESAQIFIAALREYYVIDAENNGINLKE